MGEHGVARGTVLPTLLLMVMVGHAGYQAPVVRQDPDAGSFRISVDVALVVLQATVTDRQGSVVSTLGERDFEVDEDGIPQHIQLFKNEDIPVTAGLVVDHSTSMWPKMAEVIAAARAFVRSSNREDEMFVVNFNENVSLGLPATVRFSDRTAELEQAILQTGTRGMTALYDAIFKGLEEVQAGSREKKVLIVVSDGGDNASRHSLEQVMKLAEESSAVIYTIGVFDESDQEKNPAVLKRLANATGGETFVPVELDEVVAICERIARDIRHQYTIGYVPINRSRDGDFRHIRLIARAKGQGKLSVRTRSGYIPGGQSRADGKAAR
jgi:VWFA-related protein